MKYRFILFMGVIGIILFTSFRQSQPSIQPSLVSETSSADDSTYGAWIAWWDEEGALESLSSSQKHIRTISPVWYQIDPNGQLIETNSTKRSEIIDKAEELKIRILPSISNSDATGFDSERVSKIIRDSTRKKAFIQNLIHTAQDNKYDGWDLDLEEIAAEDKDFYSQFVTDLAEKLHAKGLTLAVTVHSQTGDSATWAGAKGQDWNALAKSADEIRIMIYDFHYSASDPGPITPLNKLRAVLAYAVKTIPENKLVIGLPLYGYDWDDEMGVSVQYQDAVNVLEDHDAGYERDDPSQELVSEYEDDETTHAVWFQDSKSVLHKLAIAREYGVEHFFFWRIGGEDPTLWEKL